MKVNSLELVDLASIKVGNDAELARRLGHGRAYVSLLRSGKRPLTADLAIRLADLAGVPREVAVIAAAEARAETDAERETWARLRRLVAAACLLVVVLGGVVPAPAMAGNHASTGVSENPRGIYIMRRKGLPVMVGKIRRTFRVAVRRIGRLCRGKMKPFPRQTPPTACGGCVLRTSTLG